MVASHEHGTGAAAQIYDPSHGRIEIRQECVDDASRSAGIGVENFVRGGIVAKSRAGIVDNGIQFGRWAESLREGGGGRLDGGVVGDILFFARKEMMRDQNNIM